jgi:hypothetical protein
LFLFCSDGLGAGDKNMEHADNWHFEQNRFSQLTELDFKNVIKFLIFEM